jgi:hypothetical protein
MHLTPRLASRLLLVTLLTGAGAAARAADLDLDLLVDHDLTELGPDGVTRTVHFQERVHRREGMVWIERVLPAGAHDAGAHAAGGHDHKHLDLAAAARWITREGGVARVRLVNLQDRVVIEVPPAEYGEIGFDGSWENAWHLIDPRQLLAMKAGAGEAPPGTRWYQATSGAQMVRLLWDEKARIPRKVLSANATGTSRKQMSAREVPAPKQPPWSALAGFQEKTWSDYLD